jgi:predicted CXXCH cytochrome family protein
MKKILVALALAAFASTASALIAGGPHDLSGMSGATNGSCQYCHAPHIWTASNINVAGTPLWNRNYDSTGVTPYGTTVATNFSTPGPMSQTCLSCHVGNQDLGSIVNGTSDTLGTIAAHSVGTNLRDDHPVGLIIPATADYNDAQSTYPTFMDGAVTGLVECASCHEPHTGAAGAKFLRTGGTIACDACHLK